MMMEIPDAIADGRHGIEVPGKCCEQALKKGVILVK